MRSIVTTLDGYQWIGEAFQDDGWLVLEDPGRRPPGEGTFWDVLSLVRIPVHAIAWIVDLPSGLDDDSVILIESSTQIRPRD